MNTKIDALSFKMKLIGQIVDRYSDEVEFAIYFYVFILFILYSQLMITGNISFKVSLKVSFKNHLKLHFHLKFL